MEEHRRRELRRTFAEMVALFRRSCLYDSSLLRTLMDSWHAYYRGGHFIKRSGNPRTFNNPTSRLEFEALASLPDCSLAARKVLDGETDERIVKDHAIPVAFLRDALFEALPDNATGPGADRWLADNYRIAVLTHAEHEALEFRANMPGDWDRTNVRARYQSIEMWQGG